MENTAPILDRLLWVLLVIVMAGVVATVWTDLGVQPRRVGVENRALRGLKVFGKVPDFSLIERTWRPLGLSDLRGKIWIANFIYTTCTDTCPLQSLEMAKLQAELSDREDIRLVSITVDPDRDTPQLLSRYAKHFKADPVRWLFLTGEKDKIYRLAQEGFRLSAVPVSNIEGEDNDAIIHSNRFVLVDGERKIRGYYTSNDTEALKRLRRDLKPLLQNKTA
ncbi:MAG: SCO family protein [Candidatus Binatia bacterium]